ncbi:ATP-grasp domain-containing protein [Saccharopolyspora sp. TS4A08]|uniref:ATP-grasp domain-containing protein n=1 Tax=Saccharopolyspora ipomoeae TaxID=3042027 RepID=A0ABT6PNL4_9PSEU|nr:ATP-grasp domain-containing protein [Saccharopolyspora sp. TS4A08]MDI2029243.1 ATP-grasp domain-containing protein [Saccharopolyspora sp. TS4A08]
MTERPKNVFLLGPDERNLALMRELTHLEPYRFHPLLDKEELMHSDTGLDRLLELAQNQLDDFSGPIDAIVGYWDFPVSSMVPILATQNGLPGPSLESVVKCEHKYWSRLVQREVTDAHPGFAIIDLDQPEAPPGLRFPMWLKPVKSYSSTLAFKVDDEEQLRAAATEIRDGMGRTGEAFDFLLSMLELPPAVAEAGGMACLAEEAVRGEQITAEGYCSGGAAHVHGIIDSFCYPETSSFLRYQYPSRIPEEVQERIVAISRDVMQHIGLDSSTFNIEFFWDTETDALNVLEINPRLSQSHAPLFELVDGMPNHQAMVQLAVGEEPTMPSREGEHRMAAKWFHRTFRDALVKSTPSQEDLDRVREEVPSATIDVVAEEGKRFSELPAQDSYSYELFAVYLGADDESELRARFDRCVELLPFDLDER